MNYLRIMAAVALSSFAAVWIWVATMPMAFMDAEYASFRAKSVMLDRCDLGQAIIVGDSRAAADIIPARLPVLATNLAIGGGETVETYTALTRALACPIPPRLVIISLDPGHFVHPDQFWERGVRFGFVSGQDVNRLRDLSRQIGDPSIYTGRQTDGLPLPLRDLLERSGFPPLYFASLAHGGGLLRWWYNQRALTATLAARGHYRFGTQAGSDAVAFDGHLPVFQPLPILDRYFDLMLAALAARGIEARFIAMPVNEATWQDVQPGVRAAFAAYLAGYERRYPLFHVTGELMPHWPNRLFGDQFCHLNAEGAERFSALLAQRLQDAPPNTQNEAQNGWLSETARDASASVVPISKRRS